MNAELRAGIYLRISQDRSGEELGINRQRPDCEAVVERRGWTLHDVYIDNDVSATKAKKRPEWERMMADVEAGELQVVVGWTLDRTLRTGRDRYRMLEIGKAHGLVIALARGSEMDLSTPSGRFTADVLGAAALVETEMKSDRQKSMHAQAARMGRRIGGRRPFGYEADGVTINRTEAEAVIAAYEDYLLGTPLMEIARRWNEAGLLSGVPRRNGDGLSEWNHSGVRSVFRNPRYMGMRRHQPEPVRDASGVIVKKLEASLHPAQWPALVSESTWKAVVSLLDSTAAEFRPKGGRRLLTGIAKCGVCTAPIHVGGNSRGTPPVYRCPTGKHVTRRAEMIEDYVTGVVLQILQLPDVAEWLATADDDGETAALAAEAAEVRQEMDDLAHATSFTIRQKEIMNAGLVARLRGIETRQQRLGRASAVHKFREKRVTRGRWDQLGVDKQRVLVEQLVEVRLFSAGRGVRKNMQKLIETIEITPRGAQPAG